MSHLIMSLGETSHLVAELIGFLNYDDYPLYHNHRNREQILCTKKKHSLMPVEDISMLCTGKSFASNREKISQWMHRHCPDIGLKFHYLENMEDINSENDARAMRNLIYAQVYKASSDAKNKELYLCLSGGRKTMSSDMQQAAYLFGCKAMLHILAEGFVDFDLDADPRSVPEEQIGKIHPVIYQTDILSSQLASLIVNAEAALPKYIRDGDAFSYSKRDSAFLELIEKQQQQQDNLAINYYQQLRSSEGSSSFQALPLLHPDLIKKLKASRITSTDLDWLYLLPKSDLHCHLGGIADSNGLISIAKANANYRVNPPRGLFSDIVILEAIKKNNLELLRKMGKQLLGLDKARRWKELSAFLACFEGKEELLDELVYGKYLRAVDYCGIGLENYEKIGDYQGSSLLQTEGALRAAARLVKADAERNNIVYKELRCSPGNYTEELSSAEVVKILWDEFKDHRCLFRLIIIGSRHRKMEILREHVKLCLDIKREGGELGNFICGFDLAGQEGAMTTEKLRNEIQPLLEACIKITIHAGETSAVEDIWRAVYQLNADRIGHGLSLLGNAMLMQKLKDHRTAVELCPSSNFQITGFRDYSDASTAKMNSYPLQRYLEQGLKTCICTDDPGISRTDISREYLRASNMSERGLSKWELLILIRNGLVSAFLPLAEKQELIRKAESRILQLVQAIS